MITFISLLALMVFLYSLSLKNNRKNYLNTYKFPVELKDKFLRSHSSLNESQYLIVRECLRQYFEVILLEGGKLMIPSKITYELWIEFEKTVEYKEFSQKVFGRNFKSIVFIKEETTNKKIWIRSCKQWGINHKKPSCLPLLFTIDVDLGFS